MDGEPGSTVRIRYRRPPDRLDIFEQRLVFRTDGVLVTLLEHSGVPRPLVVEGAPVLSARSPILWFTFPGEWHDIGRFHDEAGHFTGYYANVLTPVHLRDESTWETTDLYLDVWLGTDGAVRVLDEAELEEALAAGHITRATGARARSEAARLVRAARAGAWPPAVARQWTLERARALLRKH